MQLKEASILIVDDEPILLDIMREWFETFAGKVLCAADGIEALEILAANEVDLIITDVHMPAMGGIRLLESVKTSGVHTPRVILVSGYSEIDAREAYALGADAALEKPLERS